MQEGYKAMTMVDSLCYSSHLLGWFVALVHLLSEVTGKVSQFRLECLTFWWVVGKEFDTSIASHVLLLDLSSTHFVCWIVLRQINPFGNVSYF
jgi:hypothetical protein